MNTPDNYNPFPTAEALDAEVLGKPLPAFIDELEAEVLRPAPQVSENPLSGQGIEDSVFDKNWLKDLTIRH